MNIKKFVLGEVLSVSTGVVFSDRGIDGVNNIVTFMSGCKVEIHNAVFLYAECRYYINKQYPFLNSEVLNVELSKLYHAIVHVNSKDMRDQMVLKFVVKKKVQFGDSFDVKSIQKHLFEQDGSINVFENMMRSFTG